MKIAMIGPVECRAEIVELAAALSARGHEIVTTWHRQEVEKYPSDDAVRRTETLANLWCIIGADIVVCCTLRGQPLTTFAEIGFTVAQRSCEAKRLVWLQGRAPHQRCNFDALEGVTVVPTCGIWADDVRRVVTAVESGTEGN